MSGFWCAGAVTFTEMLTTAGVTSRNSGASVGTPSRVGSGRVPAPASDGISSRTVASDSQSGVSVVFTALHYRLSAGIFKTNRIPAGRSRA